MELIVTARLHIRPFTLSDAPFILELLNDPDFIRFIADRGVRTISDAEAYLQRGPLSSYEKYGMGLWRVEEIESQRPVGMCGLIRRETLEDVDVGYAFLPQARGKGYACESAQACVLFGMEHLGLRRIVAITDPDNSRSCRVLERIGMKYERNIEMPGETIALRLYAIESGAR